jgi:GalNAc5-diNAcBac-PP-undecaprenol beta-1,3-glucosyltransferase
MGDPLVTIITVTYNRADLLKRAIISAISQTYPNFELLIVDGNSTDNTKEIVGTFTDKRIKYYRQKSNKGLLSGKNIGIGMARGDFICYLDDDDELVPDAIEVAVKDFQKLSKKDPKIKMVWFDCQDFITKKMTGRGLNKEGYVDYEKYLCERVGGEYWVVFDANALKKHRFNEKLWGAENIVCLRISKEYRTYYIPKALRIYHQEHGGNVCRFENQVKNAPRFILNNEAFLREFGQELKAICPKTYGMRLFILGFWQVIAGQKNMGLETIKGSFNYNLSLTTFFSYLLMVFLDRKHVCRILGMIK